MVQMNRKQQIALVIMALYFIVNVQANIDSFFPVSYTHLTLPTSDLV